jgi:hypothetical protein
MSGKNAPQGNVVPYVFLFPKKLCVLCALCGEQTGCSCAGWRLKVGSKSKTVTRFERVLSEQ